MKKVFIVIALILIVTCFLKISSISAVEKLYCVGHLYCPEGGTWETHDCSEDVCNETPEPATCSICILP